MQIISRSFASSLIVTLAIAFANSTSASAAPDFEKDVKPILESKCVLCHGTGKQKGGLQMHTREAMLKGGDTDPALEVGNADHSLLVERIMLDPADDEIMPQETDPLTVEEIDILKTWIADGAPWPEGVRLKAQKAPIAAEDVAIPEKAPASLAEAAATVDSLVKHENSRRDAQVAESIDGLAFLRRATVDLTGRIPTLEEIEAFEKASPDTRRAELIDRLLADDRFADRWMVFYADMLRVRSNVAGGGELLAWLNQQVAENRPYDEMVRELISANGRSGHNPAVGFVLTDDADPMSMAAAVSQVFLGVRLACAQCHDHPFDDWNQKEFYEMAGFFGKTMRRQSELTNTVYTTEGREMRVQWPPEDDNPPSREPVVPKFPFQLATFEPGNTPHYIERLEARRDAAEQALVAAKKNEAVDLDSLLDVDTTAKKSADPVLDVLAEAKKSSADLKVEQDLYRQSELRAELADMVANPRNPYFARAFVNRIWAELNGRGFVEPIDNFTAFQDISHPQTLEYLSREFIASGYDLKQLVRMITMTDIYRRGKLPTDTDANAQELAERSFTASPMRRMLSEALYDSVVIAGHLTEPKWRKGENVRMVAKQVRIPIVDDKSDDDETEVVATTASTGLPASANEMSMAMAGNNMSSAGAGYDLENSIEIDFAKVLTDAAEQEEELEKMRKMADARIEQERMARMRMDQQRRRPVRYQLKTIEEEVDDNPQFNSSMRMASPAPADHFLRVFGQPSRLTLGEFRDHSASLRQQLMMLNGKATNEAARVGTLEPMYGMLAGSAPKIDEAICLAYLECLTREPSAEELADGREIVGTEKPLEGMADLRWALLNCHEFRFLP
jgi:hypothetical protein